MKTINGLGFSKTIIPVLIAGFFLLQSCEEDIPELPSANLPALMPADLDTDAGTWKTVRIASVDAINLAAPAAITSDVYKTELAELVTLTTNRTANQNKAINYWAAGAVIRWNEIARQLVSKYNVAPPVGTPPNPMKPFANPPFSSRLYAALSVAQHDALIAAWKYKYQHNRPAPSQTDSKINVPVATPTLPSYPSEHATVAEASQKILEFFFPAEKEYLQQLATEHMNSRKWAGINTTSDIEAGRTIAAFVATQVINRAKADRMSKAADPNKTYFTIFNINETTCPKPWLSIESPERPGMLPLFGMVKTWYDSSSVYATVPPPPPAVGSPDFEADIKNVRSISDNRTREQWRIADFWADGAGTSTPPGHWNVIAQELILKNKLSEVRAARVFSLINRAMMDGGIICWYAKYKFYIPRPSQIDSEIKTATGIPNFPSYTSGHSTFSSAAGTVLAYLFPAEKQWLISSYEEAGISRVYGGIHYNFDNIAGRNTGIAIGNVAIQTAQADGAD